MTPHRLRAAEEENSSRLEHLMEEGEELSLPVGVEIDEEVAADQQVEARKGRILEEVVMSEYDHLPQHLCHLPAVIDPGKEAHEPLFPEVGVDVVGIEAGTGPGDRRLVKIGGEELDPGIKLPFIQVLADENGHRVDFFAGGAAGVPNAHRFVGVPIREESRNDFLPQNLEGLGITEEAGHADEDVLAEGFRLLRVFPQQRDVFAESPGFVHRHAALDAAQDGVRFVGAEIVAGPVLDDGANGLQFFVEGVGPAGTGREGAGPVGDLGDLFRQLLRAENEVRHPGGDGAPRHPRAHG